MAELLIRVVDKRSGSAEADRRLLQRGHVVVVVADGWQWGRGELSDPAWRILRVPGLQPDDLASLVAEEPATQAHVSQPPRLRAFSLQIDCGPLAVLDAATAPVTLPMSLDDLLALRQPKA